MIAMSRPTQPKKELCNYNKMKNVTSLYDCMHIINLMITLSGNRGFICVAQI